MHKCKKAFTLLEIVVVIAIIGVISAVGGVVLFEGYKSVYASRDILDADWQARIALERMSRELRDIRSPTTADMPTTDPTQLSFVDTLGETITYSVSSGNLLRNGQLLAQGVGTLEFNYLNSGFTAAASVPDIRYIRVDLTITHQDTNKNYITLISPRNFL